jgi:putative transposase
MKRNRTHPAIISYGLYLYFSSRSFRLAVKCLSTAAAIARTHVAIWKWIQKYSSLADRFRIDKHSVKRIFVDETLIKIEGQNYWLWVAYEPNLNVCLMMHLSRERTIFFVCYQFLKQLRSRYGRKPILTDGALGYYEACKWLRLPHQVYGTKLKNLMERFIQHMKDRTECFDDHFPCRKKKENCDMQHVWNWLRLFVLFLHMKMNRILFMAFLIMGG